MNKDKYKFCAAYEDERIVFGSQMPGYSSKNVSEAEVKKWTAFMKKQGIVRVCCLLSEKERKDYYPENLLDIHIRSFGKKNVCAAPVTDFHLCNVELLMESILPFLKQSDLRKQPVVVHCSGGIGRTGHVLAAWLVFRRGFSAGSAIQVVKDTGRNPRECIGMHATEDDLYSLLEQVWKKRDISLWMR